MSISPGGADKPAASVKLVLLGEAAVGKSSLVLRFVSNDFQENKEPTIGAAFLTQKCQLPNRTVKFEIWDTAGQERFASLAPMYYRNAQAALVVYDVTKPSSFIKARHWVSELHAQASPGIIIALVGNKVDLCLPDDEDGEEEGGHNDSNNENEQEGGGQESNVGSSSVDARKVSKQEGRQLAQEENLLFYETSAKTGLNVQQVFMDIANHLPEQSLTSRRGGGSGGGRRSGAGGAASSGRDEPLDLTSRNNPDAKSPCGC